MEVYGFKVHRFLHEKFLEESVRLNIDRSELFRHLMWKFLLSSDKFEVYIKDNKIDSNLFNLPHIILMTESKGLNDKIQIDQVSYRLTDDLKKLIDERCTKEEITATQFYNFALVRHLASKTGYTGFRMQRDNKFKNWVLNTDGAIDSCDNYSGELICNVEI